MSRTATYNDLKFAYIVVFLIDRFLLYIPTIHIPTIVTSLLLVAGIVFIITDFYCYRIKLPKNYLILIFLFFIIYVSSIIVNWNGNIFADFEGMIIMMLQLFYFFSYPLKLSIKTIRKQVSFLGIVIIILSFVCACISMNYYIQQSYFQIGDIPAWGKIYGFVKGRLYGIYVDPNLGAVIACFSICFSFYLIKNKSNILLRINIILQISYLLLSGSRTGLVCLLGCIFVVRFLLYRERCFRHWNCSQALIKAMLFTCLCMMIFGMHEKMLTFLPSITTRIEQYLEPSAEEMIFGHKEKTKQSSVIVDLKRSELENNLSNGRLQLWKDGMYIFSLSPLLGVGKYNVQYLARIFSPSSDLAILNMTTHCGYLELLIGVGLLGFIVIITFLYKVIKKYLRYLWDKIILTPLDRCIGCVVLIGLMGGIFLAEIFMVNTFITNIFWIFLGYCMSITQQDEFSDGVTPKNRFEIKGSIN